MPTIAVESEMARIVRFESSVYRNGDRGAEFREFVQVDPATILLGARTRRPAAFLRRWQPHPAAEHITADLVPAGSCPRV